MYFAWFAALLVTATSLLIAIILGLSGAGSQAKGVFAGFGVGVLALGVSCFANLSTVER